VPNSSSGDAPRQFVFHQVERSDVIGNNYLSSVDGYLTARGFRVRYWTAIM
jgi:hypothetical protein